MCWLVGVSTRSELCAFCGTATCWALRTVNWGGSCALARCSLLLLPPSKWLSDKTGTVPCRSVNDWSKAQCYLMPLPAGSIPRADNNPPRQPRIPANHPSLRVLRWVSSKIRECQRLEILHRPVWLSAPDSVSRQSNLLPAWWPLPLHRHTGPHQGPGQAPRGPTWGKSCCLGSLGWAGWLGCLEWQDWRGAWKWWCPLTRWVWLLCPLEQTRIVVYLLKLYACSPPLSLSRLYDELGEFYFSFALI